jgi:hypothetical protein
MELVQQLEDYLSDEAKMELKQVQHPVGNEVAATPQPQSNDSTGEDRYSSHPSGGGGAAPSHFSGDIMSDFGEDDLADIEPMPDDSEADIPETPSEPAEPEAVESVTQEGMPITSSTIIWTTKDDVIDDCETIKGTLNAREDTKGVSRLQVKDNELWIYYTDDTNLNDAMVSVIEVLNSVGYTYLAFSRLARSNNAHVFDITLNANAQIIPEAELDTSK